VLINIDVETSIRGCLKVRQVMDRQFIGLHIAGKMIFQRLDKVKILLLKTIMFLAYCFNFFKTALKTTNF
jgi:hypothetical protein